MLSNEIPISFNSITIHGEVLDHETQLLMRRTGITIIDRFGGEDIEVEIGDEPCTCRKTLPHIKRILGRDRNTFTFSDGLKIWPDMSRADYEPFVSVKQFQVIQHTARDIEVIYVPDDESRPVDAEGFSSLLKSLLHDDIDVRLTRVQQIPRSTSGKFETWKSLV